MPDLPSVLVLLKYPEPGRVKTRLAHSIGEVKAAQLYHDWISQVLSLLQAVRDEIQIIGYYDGASVEAFQPWRVLVDQWWPQPSGDLGVRLSAGFQRAFDGGMMPCLAMGTDCLEMHHSDLRQALAALSSDDCVFGPTHDGGYYLVGLRGYLSGFFNDIRWSTRLTLSDHLERCRVRGWSHQLLTPRHDIDTFDDWLRHHSSSPAN